jgi:hypothetical protein
MVAKLSRRQTTKYTIIKFIVQVKEDEMGRACSTNGGEEECI